MTREGIATVARQEFRLRIRAGRWKVLLAGWFLLLAALTLLLSLAARRVTGLQDRGTLVYGGLAIVVLGLSLLVVPSLSAQSVNGDRERGTLAALQVTRLSAAEITLGKFAAAWGTALLFLALTLPLALLAAAQGGVTVGRLLAVTLVLGLLLGAVCAVALWLSAALSRTTTSALLAYVVVAALTIGTLIAFALTTALTQERYTSSGTSLLCRDESAYGSYQGPGSPVPPGCQQEEQTYDSSRSRTDRTWWLLAPNPFVILADAAPALPPPYEPGLSESEQRSRQQARDLDPLGQIGASVRQLRVPAVPLEVLQQQESGGSASYATDTPRGPAVWPYGLTFDVLLAVGALVLTARRLRTPTRTLPRGQRVA